MKDKFTLFAILLSAYILVKKILPEKAAIVRNLPNSQAEVSAKIIFDAMNQTGTDETAIFTELEKFKGNRSGLKSIYDYFGIVKYWLTGRSGYIGEDLNLFGWFNEELGQSSYIRAMKYFNDVGLS